MTINIPLFKLTDAASWKQWKQFQLIEPEAMYLENAEFVSAREILKLWALERAYLWNSLFDRHYYVKALKRYGIALTEWILVLAEEWNIDLIGAQPKPHIDINNLRW